jgi:hypothetical protein
MEDIGGSSNTPAIEDQDRYEYGSENEAEPKD